ncbi:MAG: hypothetical protein R2854_29705 [Caldilineaceae bacterium]
MKRRMVLYAMLAVLTLLVAACTMPAPGGAADEGGTVELTFSVWGDPEELAILQAIADDFVAQNPGIEVVVNVSDWDTYWDKL